MSHEHYRRFRIVTEDWLEAEHPLAPPSPDMRKFRANTSALFWEIERQAMSSEDGGDLGFVSK